MFELGTGKIMMFMCIHVYIYMYSMKYVVYSIYKYAVNTSKVIRKIMCTLMYEVMCSSWICFSPFLEDHYAARKGATFISTLSGVSHKPELR